MNILHVSGVGNWGGGENHIQNLCFELAKAHPKVNNLILCVEGGQFHKKLEHLNIRFMTAKRKLRMDPRFVAKIISICKQEKIDLIHLHDPTAMQLAVIADHFAKLPPFVLSRKISYRVKNNFFSLYKYNYKKIRRYLCVSKETAEVLSEAVRDKSKIMTIYHGTRIDDKSSETPFLLREKLRIASNIKIIGNIANHYPAKDLPTLVRVLNRLVNEYDFRDFHVVQIGKPSDKTAEIERLVKEFKVEKFITFMGFTENASNFIPQFDIGLMTSEFEGIPQFIYECFYHRVPVVTTNAGGIAEIIEEGKTGFIANKRDDRKLSDSLVKLLNQSAQVEVMVEAANQQLFSQFITPVMAEKTFKVYQEITKV